MLQHIHATTSTYSHNFNTKLCRAHNFKSFLFSLRTFVPALQVHKQPSSARVMPAMFKQAVQTDADNLVELRRVLDNRAASVQDSGTMLQNNNVL